MSCSGFWWILGTFLRDSWSTHSAPFYPFSMLCLECGYDHRSSILGCEDSGYTFGRVEWKVSTAQVPEGFVERAITARLDYLWIFTWKGNKYPFKPLSFLSFLSLQLNLILTNINIVCCHDLTCHNSLSNKRHCTIEWDGWMDKRINSHHKQQEILYELLLKLL